MKQLELNGITLVKPDYDENIDLVIINTCGFIHDAKTESIEAILEQVRLKAEGQVGKIIVFGCLSERYKKELLESIPEVDYFFGKFALTHILEAMNIEKKDAQLLQRTITTPKHYSYLKISEGCNRKCAFCAIPKITGKHQSSSIGDLVKEAAFLAQQGVKEIILVAQDLNQYGQDLNPKTDLCELINRISDINEIEWIRLQYLYPKDFPKQLPQLIATNDKLCNYIDIPFQHASNKILQRMNRGHSVEDNIRIINNLREKVPDIAIRTTLITGFPGETTKDFEQLVEFVETSRFELMGAFTYSHEENTPAADKYRDNVSKKMKDSRIKTLMTIQEEISLDKNMSKIGTIQRVLVDKEEDELFFGHTQYNSPEIDNEVIIKKQNNIVTGDFYNVSITDANHFDLEGAITD